jgi:hypothetical protein
MTMDAIIVGVVIVLASTALVGVAGIGLPPLARRGYLAWIWIVTRAWSAPVRRRLMDEARMHVWSHFHDPAVAGHSPAQLAVLLLIDVVRDVPEGVGFAMDGVRDRRERQRWASGRSAWRVTRADDPDGQMVLTTNHQGQAEAYFITGRPLAVADWQHRWSAMTYIENLGMPDDGDPHGEDHVTWGTFVPKPEGNRAERRKKAKGRPRRRRKESRR